MEWSPRYPSGLYWAVGLGLFVLLLIARWFATAHKARSVLLLALRVAALGVLLTILLDPTRVSETQLPSRPPSAVYLVDCSRSMGLEQPVSRLDRAKRLIADAEARVPAAERPRIELFGFGAELAAVHQAWKLDARANESRLRSALEQLPARVSDDLPKGVIVFSDGRSTEASGLSQVAQGYRKLGLPIHVVPLGNPRSVGDVAVQDVIAPREARSGTRIPIRVVIRGRGYEGERAEVRIRSASDPNRKPLASLPVTLTDGEIERELVIESNEAKGPLVVEVPPLEREAVIENNRVPFQVVARDPKIRVIYMEGTTGNEYHWLRDALVEDPNIECLAMEVDYQYNAAQRLHRIGDPSRGYPTTREELFTYDVIICSDINHGAFTQPQLDWTVELVRERGGGFAMVGGMTSFGAGQWDKTVWDGIIPIDMAGSTHGGDGTLWEPLRVVIPRAVENHPIWKIVDDPVKNRQILDRLPMFYGSNLTDRLKPAATALGVADVALAGAAFRDGNTPNGAFNRPARPMPGRVKMPVFSCESYGKGRTFAVSTDTTVDWGRDFEKIWGEGDNRYFRKFWRNAVQWLAENSANSNRLLQVETDKVIYHPGDPVQVTARAFDARLERTQKYRLTARLQGVAEPEGANVAARGPRRSASLTPRAGQGDYQAELTVPALHQLPVAAGNSSANLRKVVLRVIAYDGDKIVTQSELDVQIMDDSPEFRDPRPDTPLLVGLAEGSGGKVLNGAAELAALLRSYQAGKGEVVVTKTPVWDTPFLWSCLLGLLTAEWIVRRVKGLA